MNRFLRTRSKPLPRLCVRALASGESKQCTNTQVILYDIDTLSSIGCQSRRLELSVRFPRHGTIMEKTATGNALEQGESRDLHKPGTAAKLRMS